MVSYKDLGLVNTREMFAKAVKGGYAIPAFNFNNMEQLQAIIQAAAEEKSPVILQVSKGARNYANQTLLRYMAEGAVQYAKELGWEHPQIVLHLDHGDSFELCKSCVDMGFSSAQETLRQAVSFHLHSLSTFSTRSRRNSLDSLSYSTDHLLFHRNMLTSSTSTAASFLMR